MAVMAETRALEQLEGHWISVGFRGVVQLLDVTDEVDTVSDPTVLTFLEPDDKNKQQHKVNPMAANFHTRSTCSSCTSSSCSSRRW